nr:MFS transporter [Candidatus Paceibacterota bacterium]
MKRSHLLHITYFLNFFFGLHAFSLLYVHSSVLSRAVGEQSVGLIYALAAASTIGVLAIVPRILRNVGDVRFTLVCVVLEILAALGIAFTGNPVLIVALFIIHAIAYRTILVGLDVFLESASTEDTTGVVRGSFLTVGNTALVIAPVLVGLLLGSTETYSKVYLFASIILLPAALLLALSFRHFKNPHYVRTHLRTTFKKVWAHPALRRITIVDFILRFFYAWMVIYMPLYLHTYVGLPWDRIGVIFTIMLIPFALFELPLGTLADKVYGEKELLIAGLSIMGATTLALIFIGSTSFLIWTIALFLTRIGAATVEIMSETYFFKQVGGNDADLMEYFRSIEPTAYIVAPLLASLVL